MNFSDELKKEMFNFAFAVYRVTDLFRPDEALRKQLREHAGEVLIRAIRYNQLYGDERFGECGSISTLLEAARSLIALARQSGLMKAINAEILIRECLALEAYFAEERTILRQATIRGPERSLGAVERQDPERSRGMLYHNEVASKRHEVKNDIHLINPPTLSRGIEQSGMDRKLPFVHSVRLHGIREEDGGINDTSLPQEKTPRKSEKSTAEVMAALRPEEFSVTERQKAIIDYLNANKEAKINDLAMIFSNRFSLKTLQRDLSRLITGRHVERQGDKRWAVYRLPELTNN